MHKGLNQGSRWCRANINLPVLLLFEKMNSEQTTSDSQDKNVGDFTKTLTEKGSCIDEVTLVFDDSKELYVSLNFLSMSSPVFKAMFTNDFLEKKEMVVKLVGKVYDDFLEFLLCIHPAVLKSIEESNVVRIVPIAEEYQVLSISSKCKKVMKKIADNEIEKARIRFQNNQSYSINLPEQVVTVRKCLIFLNTAVTFHFDDIVDHIVNALVKFPSIIYSGFENENKHGVSNCKYYIRSCSVTVNEECLQIKDLQAECLELFAKLPPEVRLRVNSKRLHILDNHIFI